MGAELAAVPGVERVQVVRNARIVFRQTPVMIVATDVKSISETARDRRRWPGADRCIGWRPPARA